jgi:protein-S-isoprenylcysteine O-methyltransferase Ste14
VLLLLRQLLSILLLPFVMVVIVPWRLIATSAPVPLVGEEWAGVLRAAGVGLGLAGFALFVWCVTLFGKVGRGTLAPWDPTRKLVAVGPYRHLRNPMISGVVLMLLGETAYLNSRVVGIWALCFLAFNHLYFVVVEEPGLEHRFGAPYRAYKANVPRWLPRRQPWVGE